MVLDQLASFVLRFHLAVLVQLVVLDQLARVVLRFHLDILVHHASCVLRCHLDVRFHLGQVTAHVQPVQIWVEEALGRAVRTSPVVEQPKLP